MCQMSSDWTKSDGFCLTKTKPFLKRWNKSTTSWGSSGVCFVFFVVKFVCFSVKNPGLAQALSTEAASFGIPDAIANGICFWNEINFFLVNQEGAIGKFLIDITEYNCHEHFLVCTALLLKKEDRVTGNTDDLREVIYFGTGLSRFSPNSSSGKVCF